MKIQPRPATIQRSEIDHSASGAKPVPNVDRSMLYV
jgi:hypothetical protein